MNINHYEESKQVLSGGVNSPVRAFSGLGINPLFIDKGAGSKIYTEENEEFIDFCLSWGVHILGHSPSIVREALKEGIDKGTSFGLPTVLETKLAQEILECYPSMEQLRFVNSGTEAVMSAVRLARGFTGKNLIIKFDGCYHGHSDNLLIKAGSGVSSLPESSSKGVPKNAALDTISIPYNDKSVFEKVMREKGRETACVIIEPVAANMGVVIPDDDFLHFVRKITSEYGILLIFDEVITGFRLGLGGAQQKFGIKPDMTILGKIIGGGLPAAAFGAGKEIMKNLAPLGEVYQAGTLSGNPLAMRAGISVIQWLKKNPESYSRMEEIVSQAVLEIKKNSLLTVNSIGSMFTVFYTQNSVRNFSDAGKQDFKLFKKMYQILIKNHIFFPPSMYETSFISTVHKKEDCLKMAEIFKKGDL
ncbi:MAG TPA: glutamate-1-semialdehyde-2,1-aminomutase [Spirochaetia bacterium]|nr:MAG: glutamate-1-semialdehyde-2,1-aminomutase [Spirochaetes bacterium GWB1_36_13]HCL57147.1 glutamate-1-semialdehyde-2,1-aminomutase [Spirochaetia bacterium]